MTRRRAPRRSASARKQHGALVAHIDGGARGNPGPAGYGVHVKDEAGRVVAELYGYLGTATNNTAEYAALLALLEYARKEIRGEYRVKHPGLLVLHAAARRLMASLPSVVVEHVPRERNVEADALANRAMDLRDSSGPLPQALRDLPPLPFQPRLH